MASVDDRNSTTASDQRHGISNSTLEIGAQVNSERAGSVPYIASRRGSRTHSAPQRDEVGTDLHLVTLVDALTAPSWFDLERIQAPLVRCAVLEDVIRPTA
jgi:hypothetical protein